MIELAAAAVVFTVVFASVYTTGMRMVRGLELRRQQQGDAE